MVDHSIGYHGDDFLSRVDCSHFSCGIAIFHPRKFVQTMFFHLNDRHNDWVSRNYPYRITAFVLHVLNVSNQLSYGAKFIEGVPCYRLWK